MAKTRKEIEEELQGNSKENRENLANSIKTLNAKIDDLRDFNISVDYRDLKSIEGLKEALKVTNESIFELKIPTEVKVINETKYSLTDKTRQFLIFSYSFAFLIVAGSIWYSNYRITEADNNAQIKFEESSQNLIKLEDQDWFIKFYQFQSKVNPKDTKKFNKLNPM